MRTEFCARQKISFLLLSQDCTRAHARVRLLHRSCRTHRVPLRAQHHCEVTILTFKHRETEAILQQSKTKIKRRATFKQREVDCAISQSGWRSSQRISKMQKCQHSQTLLMTQIRNVLRKWQPVSTVFSHFPKDKNCEICQRTNTTRAPCREPNWRNPTSGR